MLSWVNLSSHPDAYCSGTAVYPSTGAAAFPFFTSCFSVLKDAFPDASGLLLDLYASIACACARPYMAAAS